MRDLFGYRFRPAIALGLLAIGLQACSGTPFGQSLQQSFERPENGTGPTSPTTPTPTPPVTPPTSPSPTPPESSDRFTDLDQIPAALRSQVEELLELGVLDTAGDRQGRFDPNQPIDRGTFARWLLAVNNRFFEDDPGRQIRLAIADSPPVYTDVPSSNPNFIAIQSLAEAGTLPSRLSGDTAATRFQPAAPLTRADLLLWKVPLDHRQPLPTATPEKLASSWGFQDASSLDPRLQRVLLADDDNGAQSVVRRVFGFTQLFQPRKAVTRAEAAAALWYIGFQGEGQSAAQVLRSQQTPPTTPTPPTPAPANPPARPPAQQPPAQP
ncbi:S-layer homology domain-containing protein [Synechococcus elongatus]|uniref:S-layer homology domain-containing protein n=1 Tax=Synechococcus elongatus TaxID=32046 RepID=UPI0030D188D0